MFIADCPNERRLGSQPKPRLASTVFALLLLISATLNFALAWRLHSAGLGKRGSGALSAVNRAIGSVVVKDLGGKPVEIDFRTEGRDTFIYVYSPSCHWCADNLANVKELARHIQATRTSVLIGLSLDRGGLDEYVKISDLGFPTYTDVPREFLKAYGLGATPQTLVVRNGKILKDWRGAYDGALKLEVEDFFQVRLPGVMR